MGQTKTHSTVAFLFCEVFVHVSFHLGDPYFSFFIYKFIFLCTSSIFTIGWALTLKNVHNNYQR